MTVLQSILAFLVAASILTVTPGLDTAMVLRSAAVSGARTAIFAGIGICLGCLVWGGLVSAGLGALLAASAFAFTVLKLAGAAYLLWVGIGLILRPRDGLAAPDDAPPLADAWLALRRGLWTNLLNPKIGVFYVTFLPQFTPAGASVAGFSLLLAAIHVAITLVWFGFLIAATVPMSRALRRPSFVRRMDRITGAVFVGFGLNLAFTQRP